MTDCLLWEGTVEMKASEAHWRVAVEPCNLSKQLFDGTPGTGIAHLWNDFDLPERDAIAARWRVALEQGLPALNISSKCASQHVVSGYEKASRFHPLGVVAKPYEMTDLARVVRTVLAEARA